MEKSEGKRKMETEDKGFQKQSRLGTEQETPALEVAEPPPPVKQPDPLKHFVYEVGENLTSRYRVVSKIGEVVLECWDREEWEYVAIKVPRSTGDGRSGEYEVALLQHCAKSEARSRYVQFRDAFVFKNRYCIVTERLGPNLFQFLVKNNHSPVPVKLVRIYGRQILEAVANVHREKIIHTDLKLENIVLVSRDYKELPPGEMSQLRYWPKSSAIKLIDFGHAMTDKSRIRSKHCVPTVTARRYRAPEVVLGLDWTFPNDIWSVGCILAELCTGMPLFEMDLDMDLDLDLEHLATMQRVLGDLPEDMTQRASQDSETKWAFNRPEGAYSADSVDLVNSHLPLEDFVSLHVRSSDRAQLIDLLNGLLKYEPSERLTAKDALEHPFL